MTPAERLAQLDRDENPALIARMASGFAVMGDSQLLPGYCLLLAYPMVGQLNDLEGAARSQFLEDMSRLGDAVKAVTGCKRLNYSIYGNLDPFLHVHVFPRYDWEDEEWAAAPPMSIPAELRKDPSHAFSPEKHGELMEKIRRELG
jgi:diadenosine tetraphosphate (Ap4A) HIT family hydrolase